MFGHIVRALLRAFIRILLTALVLGGLAAGIILLVAFANTKQWPPQRLTEIAAIAFGVLAAYAGGMTVLLGEAVRGVLTATKSAERDSAALVGEVERDVLGALKPGEHQHNQ